MTEERRVLVVCAHSDDQAIGAGGFIAKLSKEGANVRTIVCSFGEQSHPHLKPEEIKPTRVLESQKADKILGGSGVRFLGLREGKFWQDYTERNLHDNLIKNINDFKPDMILTHSVDDPHPDHRAVHKIVMGAHEDGRMKSEIYTFDVWNLFNLRKRHNPKLIINITKFFKKKLDAIEAFKSQRHAVIMLLLPVYYKAFFWGVRSRSRYAEVYYKVR